MKESLEVNQSNLMKSIHMSATAIPVWVLVCVCLAFAELKAVASGSLYFNGPSNYMDFSAPFSIPGVLFTLEFWFKPDSLNQSGGLVSSPGDSSVGLDGSAGIGFGSDGIVSFGMSVSDVGGFGLSSPTNTIAPEQWQHVAITGVWAPTEIPVNCIYVNGILVASNANYVGEYFQWLGIPYLGGSGIAGEIGEFRIWNRALSQLEIQTKMTEVLNPTNETGLVGYWRFTEGTGNIVHDLAGTNNGILYGAEWSSDFPNTALQPPTIIQQPTNEVVALGGTNAAFSVGLSGSPPFIYQWMLNGTNIPGANQSYISITNAGLQDLGIYSVVVTNLVGTVTSSNATLSMLPFLASPFAGITVLWGQNALLSVNPGGTGPFFYQWYENGVAINEATNQNYTIPSIQFTNAGFYSVVVTSPFGSVTNTPAQVVVNPAGVGIGTYPGITITGTVGYSYSIQSTPDLLNTNGWVTLTNLTLQQTQQLWFDSGVNLYSPANPQRFYRVVPQQ